MMKKKVLWIDILKGFGIISVVVGHVLPRADLDFIYLFHMPLFFVISGYLFKASHDYKEFAIKKAFALLVPYCSIIIVFLIPSQIHEMSEGLFPALKSLIGTLIGGRLLRGTGGVFWFVTCLFATQQIFNYLFTRLSRSWLYITVLLLLSLAYVNSELVPAFWLSGNLNVALIAIPMYYAGYLLKETNLQIEVKILALMIVITVLTVVFFKNNYSLDMKYSTYGVPVFSLIASITVSYLLMKISVLVERIKVLQALAYIGRASMTIMFFHLFFRAVLIDVFYVNNPWVIILIALSGSFLMHLVFKQFILTRTMFLGSRSDFNKLTANWKLLSVNQL
jgi:fucose 4-O-acetylase-like acetyltransferase